MTWRTVSTNNANGQSRSDEYCRSYPLSHANAARTITVEVMEVVKQRQTDHEPHRLLAVLLSISIALAPISPSLIYLFPQQGTIPCYCCVSVNSSCSLKCACGCSHPGSDDRALDWEAVPVSYRQLSLLMPSSTSSNRFSLPYYTYADVPTRPPTAFIFA